MQQSLKVSIGICVYNEEKNIGKLLHALLSQNLREHELTEIIIIASGCTDKTVPVVEDLCSKSNRKIKLVVEPKREGKAVALNKILKNYRGDILIHMDADHITSKDSLHPLLEHFKEPSVGAVSGCQIPYGGYQFMDRICTVIWELHNETQMYYSQREAGQHLGGVLFAIRRGICDHVPEDIVNDDAFMGVQCRLQGYRVCFENKARALFQGPRTLSDYITQRRRVVYGHLNVKKQTSVAPKVLEMSPLKDQALIISRWVRKRWRLLPYFLATCLLELWVNIRAQGDFLKKVNPHKIWKVAVSTKNYPNDTTTVQRKEKSLRESRILHKVLQEDFQSHFRFRELRRTANLVDLDNCEILDVGCGNGLIRQFLPSNVNYVGLDFNNEYLTNLWKGKEKDDKVMSEATHLPFGDEIFDVVLNLHTIEHLTQSTQENLVSELYRVLKKGGKLIISTPNAGTWFNAHRFYPPCNPKHLHCLTHSELRKLLFNAHFFKIERFGFDIIIEYPNKVFRYVPYAFRRLLADLIPGLDKHIILRATKRRTFIHNKRTTGRP